MRELVEIGSDIWPFCSIVARGVYWIIAAIVNFFAWLIELIFFHGEDVISTAAMGVYNGATITANVIYAVLGFLFVIFIGSLYDEEQGESNSTGQHVKNYNWKCFLIVFIATTIAYFLAVTVFRYGAYFMLAVLILPAYLLCTEFSTMKKIFLCQLAKGGIRSIFFMVLASLISQGTIIVSIPFIVFGGGFLLFLGVGLFMIPNPGPGPDPIRSDKRKHLINYGGYAVDDEGTKYRVYSDHYVINNSTMEGINVHRGRDGYLYLERGSWGSMDHPENRLYKY